MKLYMLCVIFMILQVHPATIGIRYAHILSKMITIEDPYKSIFNIDLDIFSTSLNQGNTLSIFTDNSTELLYDSKSFAHIQKYPVLLYNNEASKSSQPISHSSSIAMYLFIIQTLRGLTSALNSSKRFTNWNSRSRFVVFLHNSSPNVQELSDSFKMFFREHVLNVVFVTLRYGVHQMNDREETTLLQPLIYTYFPFSGNGMEINGHEEFVNDAIHQLRDGFHFPDKTSDMKGYSVRASTFTFPPHVILSPPEGGIGSLLAGIEGTILNTVASSMNFTLIAKPPEDNEMWGIRLDNKTYTGLLGDIIYDRADIGFANCFAVPNYLRDIDISFGISVQYIVLAVPKSLQLPHWMSIILPFEPNLWICVCLVMVLSPVFLKIIDKITPVEFEQEELFRCSSFTWFYMWSSMLGISVHKFPKSKVYRIYYICFILYSLVICSAYDGSLVSFLTVPSFYPEINTIKDLVGSKLSFGGPPCIRDFFDSTSSEEDRLMYSKWHYILDIEGSLKRVAFDRDFAFSLDKRSIQFLMNVAFREFGAKMHIMEESIITYYSIVYMQKGIYLEPRFSVIVCRLLESGIIQKWGEDATRYIGTKEITSSLICLSVSHISGVFVMLCFGICMSTLVFLGEHLYNAVRKFKFRHGLRM